MGQVTIYLDAKTQAKARAAARREGRSLSSWAREKLDAAAESGEVWPAGYFELSGSVQDESLVEPEEVPTGLDQERARL